MSEDLDALVASLAEGTRTYVEKRIAEVRSELSAAHAIELAEVRAKMSESLTHADVTAAVERGMSELPRPMDGAPGKDAEIDYERIGGMLKTFVEAIPRAKDGEPGLPGKDAIVDYEHIGEIIVLGVAKEVGKIQPAQKGDPGKDATVDYSLVKEFAGAAAVNAVAALPKPKDGESGKDGKSVDEDAVVAKVLERVKIPDPIPGKDADADAIASRVLAELETRIPEPIAGPPGTVDRDELEGLVKQAVAAAIPAPVTPTKGLEVSDVEGIVERLVAPRFAAIPAPITTDFVTTSARQIAADAVKELPQMHERYTENLREAMAQIPEIVQRCVDKIPPVEPARVDEAALVERVRAQIPPPEKGESGNVDEDAIIARVLERLPRPKDGEPGKDGESVHQDTVALMVRDAVQQTVEKTLAAQPKPRDGRDALDLEIIESIEAGKSYPVGTFALHDGGTVLAVRDTDPIEDSLADAGWKVTQDGIKEVVREECDDERMTRVVVLSTSGKRFAVDCVTASGMKDQGVYRPGMKYRAGDCVTFDESYWTARRDTDKSPPGEDWRLILKGKRRA